MDHSRENNIFDTQAEKYDRWYDDNHWVFQSELFAIERLLPHWVRAVEIGVGTGRFASAFNIRLGLDPSPAMLKLARDRHIDAIRGVAESLPFRDESFDLVLMVTTICFLNDIKKSLRESYRVLSTGGHLIIGFIDKLSPLGEQYQQEKAKSGFIRQASFYSAEELIELLQDSSFEDIFTVQTLYNPLEEVRDIEPVKNGYGRGSFLVVRGSKYQR